METTKYWLSSEISEGKKRKKSLWQWIITLEALLVLMWYIILQLIALSTKAQLPILKVQLPVLLPLCMLAMGLFVLCFFIPLGKISEPTDEEIKNLAQKKLDEIDDNDIENKNLREMLKRIINE